MPDQPAYPPYPGPAFPPAAPSPWAAFAPAAAAVGRLLTPQTVLLLALVGYLGYEKYHGPAGPAPAAPVDAAKLGRAFAPEVAAAYGDGCLAAAAAVEAGKTMAEAQAATQKAFLDSRTAAFDHLITPELNRVIAPGTEPADPAARAAVGKFWRDLGLGLKGGR